MCVMRTTKSRNHDHFWIQDGILYESYNTIRGLRFLEVCKVPFMPDGDMCTTECIDYLNKELC